jgi:ABC-type nickel/cobalt efflux system permease component RcnA
MKRIILVVTVLAALAAPATALAHPLGNFTINRFSRVEVAGNRLYVLYVLDLAEIPTFQAGRIDPNVYARRIASRVELRVDGRRSAVTPQARALAHPRGAAGLRTTRFEVVLRGPRLHGKSIVFYHDNNYAGRIGWKEIVVGARTPSRSDELRAYPKDLLQSPLDVTSATATLSPTGGADVAPALSSAKALRASDRVADAGFASLVAREHLSVLAVIVSLLLAVFWGAAHALSPGHGKSIVTAYLVGRRGTVRDAGLLGLIVTVTHTLGVFALGLVTLALSALIVPEQLYPWLNLVTGILVVAIGASVLRARWRHRRAHAHAHHHQDHDHGDRITSRSLVAVGVSGGLLPCPSALVVLLAAISLHRVAFGLLLIVAFSLGLALAITGIGVVAVVAKRTFARVNFESSAVRLLPAASALVILLAGAAMTARALPRVV